MTDSVERKPEEKTNEAIAARLSQYTVKPMKEREDMADVPRWAKTAAVYKEVLGLSWNDAAAKVGRKGTTLKAYVAAPAMDRWRESLRKISDDPKALAEAILRGNALGVTLDYLSAFQGAIDAHDHREVGVMARDLLDRIGIQKKDSKRNAPAQLHITIAGGGSIDVPVVEAEWEEIEDPKQLPSG